MDEEQPPVERQPGRRRRDVGRRLAERGIDEREHRERGERAERERAGRGHVGAHDALDVQPHAGEERERDADVQEEKERVEPVAHLAGVEKVAHEREAEERQPVEPLRGGGEAELRE
jgi:hypothetical protein